VWPSFEGAAGLIVATSKLGAAVCAWPNETTAKKAMTNSLDKIMVSYLTLLRLFGCIPEGT
jgi:hypothetical protein